MLSCTQNIRSYLMLMNYFGCIIIFGLSVISIQSQDRKNPLTQNELIGLKARSWDQLQWIQKPASNLKLPTLKGKISIVRWWTAPSCPYCKNSAPALNEWHKKFSKKGVQVLGIYHHKSSAPFNKKTVVKYATNLGFEFPVAIDPQWRTLRNWWLFDNKRKWTSVTFVVDAKGVIRAIHPGGEYIKNDKDYQNMVSIIKGLIKEKDQTSQK